VILLIDNYDSFTYNLYQYLGSSAPPRAWCANDELTVAQALALRPERIVVSPGPGTPDEAGITLDLIRAVGGDVPLLGVCLGHQALGQAFGGQVVRAARIMHGKTSEIEHDGAPCLPACPCPSRPPATTRSSWIARACPAVSRSSAWTADGTVMGLRHRELPLEGVQFHPESILTLAGMDLLRNFVGLPVRA
jgi:anthranilate synthase component 2